MKSGVKAKIQQLGGKEMFKLAEKGSLIEDKSKSNKMNHS